jgi:STE24 endopeptidase
VRVPIASIDELPASAGVTSTALVAGAGAARRVFIAHELMRDWTDDEIAVVVAHEFAHHAHHDLWRTLVTDVGVMSVGLWSAAAVLRLTAQSPDGVPGDLSALPAAALVAGVVWLATAPIRHALSRRQERRADLFALQLTNRREAFQAAIRRLAASHLAEDRPSPFARWFFHRHPTPEERLQLAESFSRRA